MHFHRIPHFTRFSADRCLMSTCQGKTTGCKAAASPCRLESDALRGSHFHETVRVLHPTIPSSTLLVVSLPGIAVEPSGSHHARMDAMLHERINHSRVSPLGSRKWWQSCSWKDENPPHKIPGERSKNCMTSWFWLF